MIEWESPNNNSKKGVSQLIWQRQRRWVWCMNECVFLCSPYLGWNVYISRLWQVECMERKDQIWGAHPLSSLTHRQHMQNLILILFMDFIRFFVCVLLAPSPAPLSSPSSPSSPYQIIIIIITVVGVVKILLFLQMLWHGPYMHTWHGSEFMASKRLD